MLARKIKDYLDRKQVKYITITHSRAYTAGEVAEAAHIPGGMLAKTVIVLIDGEMAMAVLPSNHRVRLADLRELLQSDDVRLAYENEFQALFPDCEPGAVPPFGNLYNMAVYVAPDMARDGEIAFNAGSHTEIIKMAWRDFEELVKPRIASFTT
jgi:Ala-tRNA(Pro) deacylase